MVEKERVDPVKRTKSKGPFGGKHRGPPKQPVIVKKNRPKPFK